MPRYNLPFNILTSRLPFSRSASDSRLRKLMGAIRASLQGAMTDINSAIDSRWIFTASGSALDLHGETLGVSRMPCESDEEYRARLLAAFRDIPLGLTIYEVLSAIENITGETDTIDEYYKSPWLWPTPEAAIYAKFGNDIAGATYAQRISNEKVATRFQAPEEGSLESIRAYLAGSGGARQIYAGIYEDSSGAPGALIKIAASQISVNSASWYDFAFGGLPLSASSYYWLCMGGTGGGWRFYYQIGDTNQSATNFDAPPLDDPFGTPTYEDRAYSVYAAYRKIHSSYQWLRMLNNSRSRFIAAAIVTGVLTEEQLDQIAAVLAFEKPAHIVIRIVQERPGFYELLREIL